MYIQQQDSYSVCMSDQPSLNVYFLLTVYEHGIPCPMCLVCKRSCTDNSADGAVGITVANSRITIVNIVRPYKAIGC